MTDTIELLEAIGSDASLRCATAEELADVLGRAQASLALQHAVAQGDRTRLAAEFGSKAYCVVETILSPGHEDDEDEESEEPELRPG